MASGRDISIQVLHTQVMDALNARDFATAHRYCQTCLQHNAVDPVSLHLQGIICLEQGQLSEATVWVKRSLDANPRYAQAFNTLGVIADRSGKKDEALKAFQQSIKLYPDDPDVLKNLAMAHFNRGDLQQTQTLLNKGLSLRPKHSGLLTTLGLLQMKCKKFEQAQHVYETVIAQSPQFIDAHYNLAWVLEQQNQLDAARDRYQKVLELKPDHCKAHYALAALRTTKAADPAFIDLERLKRARPLSHHEATDLYFALAKMYADIGNDDAAFIHYQLGNQAWQSMFPHDAADHHDRIVQLMKATPADVFQEVAECDSDRPIFIVGMPRSGTTLVEQILASHPQIYGAGELEWIGRLTNHCLRQKSTMREAIATLSQKQSLVYGQEYLRQLDSINAQATHVIDKMPDNFQSLWLIAKLFPRAKVLHMRRNPLDTCIACFTTHFVAGHSWSSDLKHLGQYYIDYLQLMKHWRSVLPMEMLEVDYETLVTEPETESRRIVNFIGVPWDEQCLEFYKHPRAVSTASVLQVRQPIYTSSIHRWKRYEAHLAPLIRLLGPYL